MNYYGEFHNSVDEKGRIAVPSNFRKTEESVINNWVITRGMDGCLLLYDEVTWNGVVDDLKSKLSYKKEKDRMFMRFFLYPAKVIEIDKQGRIGIPKPLLEWAGISKSAVILGAVQKIEIWAAEKWGEYNSTAEGKIESIMDDISSFDF